MIWLALVAGAYQFLALIAAIRFILRRDPPPRSRPPVSVLKPLSGERLEAALTHAQLAHPEHEILYGVSDSSLAPQLPSTTHIRVIQSQTAAPNRKVGILIDLASTARYGVLVVNDADIAVPPDYLDRIVAPLEDEQVGLVTCLYSARAGSMAGNWESLGIATDFAPGVLVAPMFGVREFGMGSTLCFRRRDLEAIGGFAALADYIADDYQLARRIHALGLRIHLSRLVVNTDFGSPSWGEVWHHQVRWARTIRVSRGGLVGYLGLPVTFATLWALLTGGSAGLGLLALRLAAAAVTVFGALRDRKALYLLPLVPLRDLWAVAVWLAGLFGSTVVWRDQIIHLTAGGRITRREPVSKSAA